MSDKLSSARSGITFSLIILIILPSICVSSSLRYYDRDGQSPLLALNEGLMLRSCNVDPQNVSRNIILIVREAAGTS